MSAVVSDDRSVGRLPLILTAVAWAIFGGLIWSFFDARQLTTAVEAGVFECWAASLPIGIGAGLSMAPIGVAVGWWWHRSQSAEQLRGEMRRRPGFVSAIAVCCTAAAVVFSLLVFGAMALFRHLFASEAVHQLAISLSAPAIALLLGFAVWRLAGPIRRRLDRIEQPGHVALVTAGIVAVLGGGWAFSLQQLGYQVWNNLSLYPFAAFFVPALFAAAGAILAFDVRLRRAVGCVAILAVAAAGWAAGVEPSSSVRLSMAYGDSGTGWIVRAVGAGADHRFEAADNNAGHSAVCFPDAEPPRLGDVGRIDDEAPDIVWLTIDAVRWEHTSLADFRRDTTPNIARHAERRAAIFERAYTPATSTRQTMRSLFTGTFPSMIRPPEVSMWSLSIPDEQLTLAEFLQTAGYHTFALSSEDGIFNPDYGGLQGFETIDKSPVDHKINRGYSAPHKIDRIIEELDGGDGPHFGWAHLIEPHYPYRDGPEPVNFGDEELDRYHASLRFVDEQVDRLLEFVAGRQSEHPTYLVITADHGQAFGEHGNHRHGTTTFDEEARVPLLVWGPDVQPERHDDVAVSLVDLFSTTLRFAGLDVPQGLCGRSIADAVDTGATPKQRPVYIEQVPDFSRPYFSVSFIDGWDKLVIQPHAEAMALYDLSEDPGETHNLADTQPERLEKRLDALRRFWKKRGMEPSDYGVE